MDGANSRVSEYLRPMNSNFAPDDDDPIERDTLKGRVPKKLKAQIDAIAAIETGVKREKNPRVPTEVSVSKLMTAVFERYVLGYCSEYGLDPNTLPPAPKRRGDPLSEETQRVARSVHTQREREDRKKKQH